MMANDMATSDVYPLYYDGRPMPAIKLISREYTEQMRGPYTSPRPGSNDRTVNLVSSMAMQRLRTDPKYGLLNYYVRPYKMEGEVINGEMVEVRMSLASSDPSFGGPRQVKVRAQITDGGMLGPLIIEPIVGAF